MAEGKLESADFGEVPLPATKAPDFDLSEDDPSVDGNGVGEEQQPEAASQGEPEGVFALFDREFPQEERSPIEAAESGEFDREFSQSFETMFTAVKGDGSAPLFEAPEEPAAQNQNTENAEVPVPLPRPMPEEEPEDSRASEFVADLDGLTIEEPERGSDDAFSALDSDDDAFSSFDFSSEESALPESSLDPLQLDDPTELIFEDGSDALEDEDDSDSAVGGSGSNGWNLGDDGLEELNFDDSDEEELYDRDLSGLAFGEEPLEDESSSDEFDDFAKLALGFEDEDEEEDLPVAEEDDFVLEDLSSAPELDPFEDIAIMSSEDVAGFESPFGKEELQFRDEDPLPDDEPDPFAMNEPRNATEPPEDGSDLPEDLDPFGEEAAALAATNGRSEDGGDEDQEEGGSEKSKPKRRARTKPKSKDGSNPLAKVLLIPWQIYSKLTELLFGLLEGLIGVLGKIPLLGIPFRLLGSVLSAIPLALKKVLVLLLIGIFVWGGGALVGRFLPKPTASVSLPDSGSARFVDVELKDGTVSGTIENTGEVNLYLFPETQVLERRLFEPGSWFKPTDRGTCSGELAEIPIDATVRVSYGCDIAVEGSASLKPSLRD